MASCEMKISDELRFFQLFHWCDVKFKCKMHVKHWDSAWHIVSTTEKVAVARTTTVTITGGLGNKQQMQSLISGTQCMLIFLWTTDWRTWRGVRGCQGQALWSEPKGDTVPMTALALPVQKFSNPFPAWQVQILMERCVI